MNEEQGKEQKPKQKSEQVLQSSEIQKSKISLNEERILAFWNENNIFNKTLEKPSNKGEFVFYDGPPFATGEPHYGHVVPGTIKDIIPRYKTMQGYHVRRRWGWDCHGLPVENLIEKELGLQSKKDILDYGIGRFNEKAKNSVMRFANDWRNIIPRLGRWVDMVNDYRTMDSSYTESVWWSFKELHKKGLIYEGFKSMNLCPRCETTLSNFEVTQGYKDITDISVFVKFKIKNESNVYLLAWTTTPWTLPGNVALAINPDIQYVKVEIDNNIYILAKSRLSVLKVEYKIIEEIKGSSLSGKEYEPVFDYYKNDKKLKNKENAWKVYPGSFVTTEDGTGIVHIAPAFGADDYEFSLKYNLPFIQHVHTNGKFKDEISDFKGQDVKPKGIDGEKDAHQKADIEIIKYLAQKGTLFAKEKIVHSYPHCWRCSTPLLNYATSSWFVKVTDIKDKLVKENKKVKWTPSEVGEGRFGNWLAGARDWAISRSRFWGAPIPVWKDEKTGEMIVIGSVEDLKKYSKAKNRYFVCRHGEATNNTEDVLSAVADFPHHLTEKGKKQVELTAKNLKNKKIDLIVCSPFVRARETAEIISKILGIDKDKIVIENRIHELDSGVWNGKSLKDFIKYFKNKDRFLEKIEGGESYADIKKRMGDALYDLEKKYNNKNILIVTHSTPAFLLYAASLGLNRKETIKERGTNEHYLDNAKVLELNFSPIPHNDEYELELHRPFIDDIELIRENGNRLKRIPEVFDCWYESGSMPFGEAHYPMNKCDFNPKPGPFTKILGKTKGYPADFIAEGLDQTRGWFYSMLVLGVALFGRSPYKKVVVNGLVLAEDGQKMAKSKKNYPDLMIIVDKYGADALRYYLMSSPVVHADDFCFSEKGVDEVVKKHIGRLNNVVTFYEMYADPNSKYENKTSNNHLDLWIVSRLNELVKEVTENLEKYEIDRASRSFADFIDDLSTWYIRRSRDRFKGENIEDRDMALSTTRNVLLVFVRLLAPFMPFISDDIYMRLKGDKESVHLDSWPEMKKFDKNIIESMKEVRRVSSLGLEARMKAKINVRQPLSKIAIKSNITDDLLYIIKDEVNIKEIIVDNNLTEEVILDININKELKEEGIMRELIRIIQDLRKEKGLTIKDNAVLGIGEDNENTSILKKYKDSIMKTTGLSDIQFVSGNASPYIHN